MYFSKEKRFFVNAIQKIKNIFFNLNLKYFLFFCFFDKYQKKIFSYFLVEKTRKNFSDSHSEHLSSIWN